MQQRVWQISRAMGVAGWDAEILLVDPSGNAHVSEADFQPTIPVYSNLATALREASAPQVGIVEAGARLTETIWESLQTLDPETVRVAFTVEPVSSRSKRVWLWMVAVVTRLLLRTRKNEYVAGISLFRGNQIRHFLDQLPGRSPNEDVIRLLALTRQQGQHACEQITFSRGKPMTLENGILMPAMPELPKSKLIRRSIARLLRFWFTELMFPVDQCQVSAPKPKKKKNEIGLVGLLVVLAIGLLFSGIGFPLLEPDEARNAQLALNIHSTGNWSDLVLRGEHYYDKPPLQLWAIAASHQVFGPSPWSTRFPVAFASFLTVMLTYFVGRRLVGFRAAWTGALCLLLTIGFLLISRYVTMDASLTTAVTATVLFGLLSIRGLGGRMIFSQRYAVCTSIAVGVGVMLKGPLIVVLCLPPLLLATWFCRPDVDDGRKRSRRSSIKVRLLCYVLPALLVAAPWYVWSSITQPEFLHHFVWKHNVVRFVDGFNHQQPFYFYVLGIFVFMFPVSYLFPSLIKFLVSRNQKHQRFRSREVGVIALVVIWMFVFFSMSTSKLATYIVPTFPLICLMLGVFIEQRITLRFDDSKTFLKQLVFRAPWELPAWTAVLAGVAIVAFEVSLMQTMPYVIISCVLGILVWFGRGYLIPRRERRANWIAFACMAGILAVLGAQVVFPAIAQKRSDQQAVQDMLAEMREATTADVKVVFVGRDPFAASMTLDTSQVVSFREDEIDAAARFVEQQNQAIMVASREPLENLKNVLTKDVSIKRSSHGRHVFTTNNDSHAVRATRGPSLRR